MSLLVAGSHLLLSCLGFSSASYLKVHVKTHHGVPLPQVSRHQESIPNGGAAFHCVRTYGIKGKRLAALHLAALCRTLCVGCWAGCEKGEGGKTVKTLERSLGRCRETAEHHIVFNTCPWTADFTSLGEGDALVRVHEFLAASLIFRD